MKKNVVTATVTISLIALAGIVIGGIFWWTTPSNTDDPKFIVTPQGTFASGPTVSTSGDVYTITWSTTDNYPSNDLALKKEDADNDEVDVAAKTEYNATRAVYVHTATFRLSKNTESSNDVNNLVVIFAEAEYSYQAKSTGLSDKEYIASAVEPL